MAWSRICTGMALLMAALAGYDIGRGFGWLAAVAVFLCGVLLMAAAHIRHGEERGRRLAAYAEGWDARDGLRRDVRRVLEALTAEEG